MELLRFLPPVLPVSESTRSRCWAIMDSRVDEAGSSDGKDTGVIGETDAEVDVGAGKNGGKLSTVVAAVEATETEGVKRDALRAGARVDLRVGLRGAVGDEGDED